MLALALSACGPSPVDPSPASPEPSIQSSPDEVTAPEPGADAEVALRPFAAVTAQIWASEQRAQGRAYIDALIAAGFSRDAMQVTADLSTVGNAAESLQFSVAWNDAECLVGQVGPSTGEPVTAVLPRLSHGACLIGATRPIDW